MRRCGLLLALAMCLGCTTHTDSVRIDLPLPPKLDLTNYENVFLPGFIADVSNDRFDANQEAINFFTREFKRKEVMTVVDQGPVDLSEMEPREFFAREQPFFKNFQFTDADKTLAVTGVVSFEQLDRSGFREVANTDNFGRRYYRTQFVEITGFNLNVRIFVYDLNEGKLLYRELLRDTADIEGSNIDQRLVFYELLQRISDRVMGLFASTNVKAERSLL